MLARSPKLSRFIPAQEAGLVYPGRWVRQPVTLSLRFNQVFDLQGKFRPWRRGGTFACVLVATFAAVYAKGVYRVRNWSAYHAGLIGRGDVTMWIDQEPAEAGHRG